MSLPFYLDGITDQLNYIVVGIWFLVAFSFSTSSPPFLAPAKSMMCENCCAADSSGRLPRRTHEIHGHPTTNHQGHSDGTPG
jgi:hypothetical protein